MNKIYLSLLFCLAINHLQGQAPMENILNSFSESCKTESRNWSFYAVCGGKTLAEHNISQPLIPASIQKLITTGTALIELDKDFRYETHLEYEGELRNDTLYGNLILRGNGDPSFASDIFESTNETHIFQKFYSSLEANNIRVIKGSIIVCAAIFDSLLFPTKAWPADDYGNYYAAGTSGMNYHENYYTVSFKPGKKVGDKTNIIKVEPAIHDMQLINDVITAAPKTGDKVIIMGEPYQWQRRLTGTIPADVASFPVKGSMPDPADACAWNFHQFLQSKGIRILSNPKRTFHDIAKGNLLDVHVSPKLKELVYYTNMQSNNIFAESFMRSIAVKYSNIGTDTAGIRILKKHFGNSALLYDGSGMSPLNRINTKSMVAFLEMMKTKDCYATFNQSLPIAGVSGTLKDIFIGTSLQNNLRAKSGSMKEVRCYAGYMVNSKNENITFCIMVNQFGCSTNELINKIQELLLSLY